MLLDIHLELGPPKEIVRYFEILIERWPEEEVSFEQVLKIGAAYEGMGEFERSFVAFRGTVEGRFMREMGVAGFLESQDEFLRSVAFMQRLLQEYPSEGYAATAMYALAQRVASQAPEAKDSAQLRSKKITRIDLTRHAARMLDDFLTIFPQDPSADQAAFARANALLEMEAYDQAIADCNRYLVVCRGENLHTSGLVILSPLSLDVHQDRGSRQVRATVKNVVEDRCERDVHIKVIGSRNRDFVSGSTDLRGIFVADAIQGEATVIAFVEPSRYALHRGAPGVMPTDLSATPSPAGDLQAADGVALIGSETGQRIKAVLKSPTSINMVDEPLEDVAEYLGRVHRINIQLDKRALDDVNMGPNTSVTANLSGVSLRSALRLILGELDLTYVIRDEVLMITTPEEAELQLTTKMYPVSDLVKFKDPSGETWADYDTLIELLTATVQPESWEDVGGPGAIAPMSIQGTDVLTVRQTEDVHEEIAAVFAKLRSLVEPREGGELPVRKRSEGYFRGMGGMGSGGLGGMGGMGGGFGAPSAEKTNLLQGLQETNRTIQGKQVEQFDKMLEKGGMGGGMGAGFF